MKKEKKALNAAYKKKERIYAVPGLGLDKRRAMIDGCPECRALKHDLEKRIKEAGFTMEHGLWELPINERKKYREKVCKLHANTGTKRRFGSGITRRRWRKGRYRLSCMLGGQMDHTKT